MVDHQLDRKISLCKETEYPNLYEWSLQETDENGTTLGGAQVPWEWSLYFTATTLTLNESYALEKEEDENAKKIKVEEREYIEAELRPGRPDNPYNDYIDPTYSMFGTGRKIKSFEFRIYKLRDDSEEKADRCKLLGDLGFTSRNDYDNDETFDDSIVISLRVAPERYNRYADMLKHNPANTVVLRLGDVSGFYSEWSREVSTRKVKVLTRAHEIDAPEGIGIRPPTLGDVGEFEMTFWTKSECDKPRRVQALSGEGSAIEQYLLHSPEEAGRTVWQATLDAALRSERMLKQLSYAAWAIVILLFVLVFRR